MDCYVFIQELFDPADFKTSRRNKPQQTCLWIFSLQQTLFCFFVIIHPGFCFSVQDHNLQLPLVAPTDSSREILVHILCDPDSTKHHHRTFSIVRLYQTLWRHWGVHSTALYRCSFSNAKSIPGRLHELPQCMSSGYGLLQTMCRVALWSGLLSSWEFVHWAFVIPRKYWTVQKRASSSEAEQEVLAQTLGFFTHLCTVRYVRE